MVPTTASHNNEGSVSAGSCQKRGEEGEQAISVASFKNLNLFTRLRISLKLRKTRKTKSFHLSVACRSNVLRFFFDVFSTKTFCNDFESFMAI